MRTLFIISIFLLCTTIVFAQTKDTSPTKEKVLPKGLAKTQKQRPVSKKTTTIAPNDNHPKVSKGKKVSPSKTKGKNNLPYTNAEEKEKFVNENPKAYQALKEQQAAVRLIQKKDYDKLPPKRKAVIDANPDKYQVVDNQSSK